MLLGMKRNIENEHHQQFIAFAWEQTREKVSFFLFSVKKSDIQKSAILLSGRRYSLKYI